MRSVIERLHFEHGRIRDGERRYLLLRADVLAGMLHELDAPMRQQVLAALKRSVAKHGGDSVRAYAQTSPKTQALLNTVSETAAQLGWGRWRLEVRGRRLELDVDDSPFAAAFGASAMPVCAAIEGMLQAVAQTAFGEAHDVSASEIACMAQGHARCRFVAELAESR